ncbi:MAG: hypothetical protein RL754_1050 [Bacteroidota bacterium]
MVGLLSLISIYLSIPFKGQFQYEYRLGQVWLQDDLVAPIDFVLPKSDEDLVADRNTLETSKDLIYTYQFRKDQWSKSLTQYDTSLHAAFENWQIRGVVMSLPKENHRCFLEDGSLVDLSNALTPAAIRAQYGLPDSAEIQPTFVLNEELTDSLLNYKLAAITLNKGIVVKGTPIILRGAIITQEKYEVIRALERNYDGGSDQLNLAARLGALGYILLILAGLFTYVRYYDKAIIAHSSSLNLFLFSFTGAAIATLLISSLSFFSPYAVPILLLPVIIRSFFNDRLALITTIFLLLLIGPFVSGALQLIAVQFAAAFTALLNIRGIYKRSQLFQSTLRILIILTFVHLSIHLVRQSEWSLFALSPMVASLSGSILLLFIFPIIYLFERIFGVVSDLTLLELSDTNSPLLKRLSKEAPGTFQHTMQVANLAEHATELVGGNTLLVRTGALYHDIGKLSAPQYFTENQSSQASPHDELSYTESAAIIIGHVEAGIELAKKNHLPDLVVDFIRTHHGTSRVEYFYRKFKEDHPDASEFDQFQYPGPKPFSKETAIVMMSDAVEASTRSLPEKTQINLSTMIDRVIDHQLTTGQLDNADITLKEINTIREAFKKFMRGVYHVRIEYPNQD